MKRFHKIVFLLACLFSCMCLAVHAPSTVFAAKAEKKAKAVKADLSDKLGKPNAAFDANKMADMSDFDPSNPVIPTGDTIKIAVVAPFSGPATSSGEGAFFVAQWAAHDINKRGGIWVDDKKKLVQIIKADNMSKQDQCKKICERMVLQEKVHFLVGTNGSNLMKVLNETASKYKVIAVNVAAMSDELQDAANFTRYGFMSIMGTSQIGRGLAYYYGQIRKKEKKFYILCQDYMFGHGIADGFKMGLKEYFPEAQIVGEDYHKLFQTDYASYLTKIKASGAEVVYSGDWPPDSTNLLKQARQMGLTLPMANMHWLDIPSLYEVGMEGSKGLVNLEQFENSNPTFKNPGYIKMFKTWNDLWKTKWKTPPFNTRNYELPATEYGARTMMTYWLLSVIERARSTDPEKIIKVWEGDAYKTVTGKILKMRACDHRVIQNLTVSEYVPTDQQKVSMNIPPYYWFKDIAFAGERHIIPAEKILPLMDQKLDRCKAKNDWGE